MVVQARMLIMLEKARLYMYVYLGPEIFFPARTSDKAKKWIERKAPHIKNMVWCSRRPNFTVHVYVIRDR
jgi:hypothetical protein